MGRKDKTQAQKLTLVLADDPCHAEIVSEASNPDGSDEHLFIPLENESRELAAHLKRRFVERWLPAAGLPLDRYEDALETVELKFAPDEPAERWRLRLRSYYTGVTYWLYEWDRSRELADTWIDDVADTQGANVKADRKHGPTPWDVRPR